MKTIALIALACFSLMFPLTSTGTAGTIEDAKYQRVFEASMDKGLDYLARSQAANGAIGGNTPAITSLAIMAFLARGYSPGLPPYGDVINRGIDHILSVPDAKGTLVGGGGQMYSHNISTLMLSEVSGMVDPERQARIDVVLPRALNIILAAQAAQKSESSRGGWRYTPTSNDSDISHSGWALMALRSARNNGAPVPKEAIDEAVKYILRCRTADGGFAYQPGGGSGLARTAIGLLCLELSGRHRDDVTLKAGQYVEAQFKPGLPGGHKYYAFYYCANGMFQLGGAEWEKFAPTLYDTILTLQSGDGSWTGEQNPEYCTSMAILALSVSCRQLPIYQR